MRELEFLAIVGDSDILLHNSFDKFWAPIKKVVLVRDGDFATPFDVLPFLLRKFAWTPKRVRVPFDIEDPNDPGLLELQTWCDAQGVALQLVGFYLDRDGDEISEEEPEVDGPEEPEEGE